MKTVDETLETPINDNCFKPWHHGHCRYPSWDVAGPSPLTIIGMVKWELRQHFQPNKIFFPGIKDYIWVPRQDDPDSMDEESTKIIIESVEVPRREVTGTCPSILVKRTAFQPMTIGLNHNSGNALRFPSGGMNQHNLYTGGVQLFVQCSNYGTVELIAWEAMQFFTQFEGPITKEYRLMKFACNQMSEVGIDESTGVEYAVVIGIEVAFNSSWEVAVQAPRFKNVRMITEDE